MTTVRELLAVTMALLLVAVPASAGVPPSGPTAGLDGSAATEIDSCTTIDEPGRYVLAADIEDSKSEACITIAANDVVLDGRGHIVDGVKHPSDVMTFGVHTTREVGRNVTIRNVRATDWSFGVNVFDVRDGAVESVIAENNRLSGVLIEGSESVVASGIHSSDNGQSGVFVVDSTDVTVRDSIVTLNGGNGVSVARSSSVVVSDVKASNNRWAGFRFGESTDGTLANSTARGNALSGVILVDSTSITVSDVVSSNNSQSGFALFGASNNRVTNSTAEGNDLDLVFATNGSSDNAVRNLRFGESTVSFNTTDVAVDSVDSPPAPPENAVDIGAFVKVEPTDTDARIAMTIRYTEEDLPENVSEDSLAMWRFDGSWSRIEGSTVDADANSVSATVSPLPTTSVLAPLGTESEREDDVVAPEKENEASRAGHDDGRRGSIANSPPG